MKNKVLVDTCIWIEFFKGGSDTGERLASLIVEDSVIMCGVVLFELLQGIKSDTEKITILNAISELPYIEMDKTIWERSAAISSSLRKNGVTVPISDILMASISLQYNLSIFTFDKHFESIPGVNLYRF